MCFLSNTSDIYSLCVSYPDCHLDKLYNSTYDLLVDHVTQLRRVRVSHYPPVSTEVILLLQKLSQGDMYNMLQLYADSWENYREGAQYLNVLYRSAQHYRITRNLWK